MGAAHSPGCVVWAIVVFGHGPQSGSMLALGWVGFPIAGCRTLRVDWVLHYLKAPLLAYLQMTASPL